MSVIDVLWLMSFDWLIKFAWTQEVCFVPEKLVYVVTERYSVSFPNGK